eukprot:2415465-Heterocapsa_arctica.AAC.1
MVQHTCKTTSYSRRSDVQQVEYQKQEVNKVTDRHRQTLIGEEQSIQGKQTEADKLGPKEDARKMRLYHKAESRRTQQNTQWQNRQAGEGIRNTNQ